MSEQWHFVIYWLQKLSSMKNNYKMHNLKLLAIVETFKQWCHYLKNNKYSVEILTDHNNLHEFINIKTLNKKQAQWAVKLLLWSELIGEGGYFSFLRWLVLFEIHMWQWDCVLSIREHFFHRDETHISQNIDQLSQFRIQTFLICMTYLFST